MSESKAQQFTHDPTLPGGNDVVCEIRDGIAFVSLNRPEKRNCINPGIVKDANAILDALEMDDRAKVIVITGSGDSFSAGQDLKEYFREPAKWHPTERERLQYNNSRWQWRKLLYYNKPTIAMVNGWCFGGAFQVLVGCDIAVAADEASFGMSEINWGIIPAGIVTKSATYTMTPRKAMYYIISGDTFNGKEAEQYGLVTFSVPQDELMEKVKSIAANLMKKNPHVLRSCKVAYHYVRDMSWDMAAEYLSAKSDQNKFTDPEGGAAKGMTQFLDEKSYRPGLGAYDRER
ncbi:MAG: p-hydroxycinnamoyl CoA hydratase/lyase [Beijerinckiaceae bacterium]